MRSLTLRGFTRALAAAFAAAALALSACDDSNAVKEQARTGDGGPSGGDSGTSPTGDGGPLPDGAAGDCVQNPRTHEEIINGCTDAVKITKNPSLPLLYPDGGLPPLP